MVRVMGDASIIMCGATGKACTRGMGILSCDMLLYNETVSKYTEFKVKFKVVSDIPYDMIIKKLKTRYQEIRSILGDEVATHKHIYITTCAAGPRYQST